MTSNIYTLLCVCSFVYLASASDLNSTYVDPSTQVLCSYPLSGQYGFLPRLLYYLLIVFSFFGRKHVWLVTGALAYILTYSATAAVHAFILAIVSKNSLLDADSFGVWCIVSAATMAFYPTMELSTSMHTTNARPAFAFWGLLMGIGSLCGIAAIMRDYPTVVGCPSPSGTGFVTGLITSPEVIECKYICNPAEQALRGSSEIFIMKGSLVFGSRQTLMIVTAMLTSMFGVFLSLVGCFMLKNPKRTEAELHRAIAGNDPAKYPTRKTKNAARNARARARAELRTGEYQPGMGCFTYINPILFPVIVIINEVYLMGKGGFPVNEAYYSVGQWSPWVTVALTVIAAAIVRVVEPKYRDREEQLKQEKEEFLKRKKAQQQEIKRQEEARKQQKKEDPDASGEKKIEEALTDDESAATNITYPPKPLTREDLRAEVQRTREFLSRMEAAKLARQGNVEVDLERGPDPDIDDAK